MNLEYLELTKIKAGGEEKKLSGSFLSLTCRKLLFNAPQQHSHRQRYTRI